MSLTNLSVATQKLRDFVATNASIDLLCQYRHTARRWCRRARVWNYGEREKASVKTNRRTSEADIWLEG
jgi:hypothetical protein